MSRLLLGSGEVRPGATVVWGSIVGEQRGRVANMRAGGFARVEVFAPYRENGRRLFAPSGQIVDLPLGVLRPMLAARAPTKSEVPCVIELQAKAEMLAELSLYGDIGGFDGAITAPGVKAALKNVSPKAKLNVYLSSPGGSPLEAFAIASVFQRWQGVVSVFVDGIAASAATLVAVAGQYTYMSAEALFMIHRAWTAAIGDRDELSETIEVLEKVDGLMADAYARKTGLAKDKLLAMMSDETWMDSQQARKLGFIDGVVEPPKRNAAGVAAMMDRPWFSRLPSGSRRPILESELAILPAVSRSPQTTASADSGTGEPAEGTPEGEGS